MAVPAGALWFPGGPAGVAFDSLKSLLSFWMIFIVLYIKNVKLVEQNKY